MNVQDALGDMSRIYCSIAVFSSERIQLRLDHPHTLHYTSRRFSHSSRIRFMNFRLVDPILFIMGDDLISDSVLLFRLWRDTRVVYAHYGGNFMEPNFHIELRPSFNLQFIEHLHRTAACDLRFSLSVIKCKSCSLLHCEPSWLAKTGHYFHFR